MIDFINYSKIDYTRKAKEGWSYVIVGYRSTYKKHWIKEDGESLCEKYTHDRDVSPPRKLDYDGLFCKGCMKKLKKHLLKTQPNIVCDENDM